MYSVDWTRFIRERVFSPSRQPAMLAWLRALISPVVSLHTSFQLFRIKAERNVTITPHVRVLEYWLNEIFDPTARQIEIKDYYQLSPLFIFLENENRPVYLPTFIGASNYDFEVCVPCSLVLQEQEIRGFLDRYKLATKRYLITWTGDCN